MPVALQQNCCIAGEKLRSVTGSPDEWSWLSSRYCILAQQETDREMGGGVTLSVAFAGGDQSQMWWTSRCTPRVLLKDLPRTCNQDYNATQYVIKFSNSICILPSLICRLISKNVLSPDGGRTPGEPGKSRSTKAQYTCRPNRCTKYICLYICWAAGFDDLG